MAQYAYKELKFSAKDLELIEHANRIARSWLRQGYDLTLRQLYYQLVKENIIRNDDKVYISLGNTMTRARMGGLFDWDYMQDRHRSFHENWINNEDAAEIMRSLPYQIALDLWEGQDYHVEVWVEKDALSQIVGRAASEMNVGHMACKGYLSSTMMHEAAMRFLDIAETGRQPVVIYLGDHDPSGLNMPQVIERQLNEFISWHSEFYHAQVDHVALSRSQIRANNAPPNPAKMDDPRAKKYVKEHGESSWELDALTPRQMHDVIVEAVLRYRDEDTFAAVLKEQTKKRAMLTGMADNFHILENGLLNPHETEQEKSFYEFGEGVRNAVRLAELGEDTE